MGTRAENTHDRNMKRRSARGERNGRARFTWSQVRKIRQAYAFGEASQTKLALQYGADRQEIWKIVHGKIWEEVA
jgi:hypothetical protein